MLNYRCLASLIVILFTATTAYSGDYNYDVSGYGDEGYAYGEIDATSDSKEVDGTIINEEGREVYFEGEWTGKGIVEGYDEEGNYYELEVE